MLNTAILKHLKECQVDLESALAVLNDLNRNYINCYQKIKVAVDSPQRMAGSQTQVAGYLALIDIYLQSAKTTAELVRNYHRDIPEELKEFSECMYAVESLELAVHRALHQIAIETKKIRSEGAINTGTTKILTIEGFGNEIVELKAAIAETENLIYKA